MAARDALIEALEKPGAGLLVHPYRGRFNVVTNGPSRFTESSDRGGMAIFQLSFIESFDSKQPTARKDTPALVKISAARAMEASIRGFVAKFKTALSPAFVALDALNNVNSAIDAVRGAVLVGFADINVLPGFISQISSLKGNVELMIGLPEMLGAKLAEQISALGLIFDSPKDHYSATISLVGSGPDPVTGRSTGFGSSFPEISPTTPATLQQSDNQTALIRLIVQAALIESALASSRIEFSSRNEAQQMLDALISRMDNEMLFADDDVFEAFSALKAAVVSDITARGADLASVVSFTPRATLPALVIAHQIYGDATRADEIVDRNRIRHPGFVPGGQALEVLTA